MHAKCSKYVYYAGEFHVRPILEGADLGYKIVIDNNSGTYGPDPACLGYVEQLLKHNFPGLEVETLSYDDPKLKQYKEGMTML